MSGLTVLAVDDETPALDELSYLLGRHPAVDRVVGATDATAALRALTDEQVDAAFLDISMPGLSGMELAGVLARYANPPAIVFVTAHDDRALEAFEVGAVDYLLKPLRTERLAQSLEKVLAVRSSDVVATATDAPATPEGGDQTADQLSGEVIPVELAGVTSLIRRDSVSWVEAVGDYARLHTTSGAHLVRVTLSTLETHWRPAGFARVHRSYLVALPMVTGLRSAGSATTVLVRANGDSPEVELPVSRRQVRELKDRLVRDPLRSFRASAPPAPGA